MEKLKVNENCIGCGLCVNQFENYFEFNDDGLSVAKDVAIEENDKKELLNIIEACPGEAIVIEEEK
jgi:ferredoxin